jgi:hypothetical protein
MCESDYCIDGVCCNEVCNGVCRSCIQQNTGQSDGRCSPVRSGEDPDNNCPTDPSSSCLDDGVCDGAGSCRKYPAGTPCGLATCDQNDRRPPSSCDGQGQCIQSPPESCGLHRCFQGACTNPCRGDDQCIPEAFCDGGTCRAKKKTDESCTEDRECLLGVCVGLLGLKVCL